MGAGGPGYVEASTEPGRAEMTDRNNDTQLPTPDQPLNGPRRANFGPLMLTLLILTVIAVVFLGVFLLR
jgi:hypothetical protein